RGPRRAGSPSLRPGGRPCAKPSAMSVRLIARARAGFPKRRWRARSSPVRSGACVRLAALALAGGLVACAEVDPEQARLCERLLPAIEAEGAQIELVRAQAATEAENAVRIDYRVVQPDGVADHRWITCRFGGGGFERDRLRLTGVVTAAEGTLSDVRVFMLRRYWLDLYEQQAGAADRVGAAGRSWSRDALYFLQLGVNGVTVGCLYGLLAIGYTLVYGIVGRINLAFGEIAM